jgi:hypothetical protein
MSNVDYTPMILAQITDLQMRLTKQDETISALRAEVERLSGRTLATTSNGSINSNNSLGHPLKTSVPLQHKSQHQPRDNRRDAHRDNHRSAPVQFIPPLQSHSQSHQSHQLHQSHQSQQKRTRPQVAKTDGDKPGANTMALSDVLKTGEEVIIQVGTGKDEEGNFTQTHAYASFDGTDLTVTKCELVPSLINMKSSKPGEILYKFIDELKEGGHIRRTFSIGPWKLCFVERNGVRKSLEELRHSTTA